MSELVLDRINAIQWATFLLEIPPGQRVTVVGLSVLDELSLTRPELLLFCENCKRETINQPVPQKINSGAWSEVIWLCACLQCGGCPTKRYYLRLENVTLDRPK